MALKLVVLAAEEAVTREGVSELGKVRDFEFHRERGCFGFYLLYFSFCFDCYIHIFVDLSNLSRFF